MATRESLETLGSDKVQTRESLETLGSDKVQTRESLETLGSNAPTEKSFYVDFYSNVHVKPTEIDVFNIPSFYKTQDDRNILLNISDLQKISIDEKIFLLNYNKFNFTVEPTFYLKNSVPDKNVKDFRNFVEKLFNVYYENYLGTPFSLEQLQKDFTFAELSQGSLRLKSKLQPIDCSVQALSLDTGTLSIRLPIGLVVNKYSGRKEPENTTEVPLQRFFISINNINIAGNSSSVKASFYDKQIGVNGTFSYFIQTVDLVINYKKDKYNTPESISFITQYEQQNSSSYDDVSIPPMPPSIDIRNYSNINNKLLILLGVNEGSDAFEAKNINLFSQQQKDFFAKIYKDKGINYPNNKYIYSASQNQERFFLVYRIDSRPTSYDQIISEKNIIKKLDIQKLENSFDDKISPNKKYYYCFLVQDSSGILSDASLVYETEMVDQGGTVYLKQSAFIPELKTNFISAKDFQDRVRIFPTDAQINIPPNLLEISYTNKNYISFYVKKPPFGAVATNLEYNALKAFFQQKIDFKSLQSESAQKYNKQTIFYKQFQNTEDLLKIDLNSQEIRDNLDISFSFFKDKQISYAELRNFLKTNILQNSNIKYITFANFKIIFGNGDITNLVNALEKYDPSFYFVLHTQDYDFLFNYKDSNFSILQSQQKEIKIISDGNSILLNAEKKSIFDNIQKNIKLTFTSTDFLNQAGSLFTDNKVFKARIESQNSKKKFDLNITYNLQIPQNIQPLQNSGITKQFEILKTEPL